MAHYDPHAPLVLAVCASGYGLGATCMFLHTDGSKDKNKVAAAAVMNKNVFSARLQDEATIFSAEAKEIELAFDHIKMSKCYYTHVHILQSLQIHFPVYSPFIV